MTPITKYEAITIILIGLFIIGFISILNKLNEIVANTSQMGQASADILYYLHNQNQ